MHAFSLLHIDQCLRLLDSYLLNQWSEADDFAPVTIQELDPEENNQLSLRLVAISAAADLASRDDNLYELRQIGIVVS